MRERLRVLKSHGKKIFVVTNYHVEFMDITMKATIGDDWKDFFDICIANSKKPLFHDTENPFYELNLYAKDLKGKKYDSSHDFK
jgi:hypothetical protein